ncbi:MAG: hypothetical protein DDT23_00951 [candidate division WS2 bacterium]|nr:hypothetical protein [Candidatus Lithacetigena glycinireducens]
MRNLYREDYEVVSKIVSEASKIVIGKDELKELLIIALLSQGHILIEGHLGSGKTTLSKTFAQVIGGKFKRVQGTPDMLPADILGFYYYRPDGTNNFIPGPIFTNVLLVDELNRITPRALSALIEATAERQITIEGKTHYLEQPFLVIASQVPFGSVGTSPIPDVQMDRFMFHLWSDLPTKEEEDLILKDIDIISQNVVESVITPTEIIELQKKVEEVYVAGCIRQYILSLINKLRQHPDLIITPSPRGSIALLKGARAHAFLQGRDYVIPDDVKKLMLPSLSHRIKTATTFEKDGITPESIIIQTSMEVPTPRMEE